MGMKNPWTINDPASFHPFVRSKQTIPIEGRSQPYDAWTQEGALPLPLPGLPYSEREAEVGSPSKTVLMTPSKSVILLSSVETPMLPEIFVVNDYIASWIATVGAIAALRR